MRQWTTIRTIAATECRHCVMSTLRRQRKEPTPLRHYTENGQAVIQELQSPTESTIAAPSTRMRRKQHPDT